MLPKHHGILNLVKVGINCEWLVTTGPQMLLSFTEDVTNFKPTEGVTEKERSVNRQKVWGKNTQQECFSFFGVHSDAFENSGISMTMMLITSALMYYVHPITIHAWVTLQGNDDPCFLFLSKEKTTNWPCNFVCLTLPLNSLAQNRYKRSSPCIRKTICLYMVVLCVVKWSSSICWDFFSNLVSYSSVIVAHSKISVKAVTNCEAGQCWNITKCSQWHLPPFPLALPSLPYFSLSPHTSQWSGKLSDKVALERLTRKFLSSLPGNGGMSVTFQWVSLATPATYWSERRISKHDVMVLWDAGSPASYNKSERSCTSSVSPCLPVFRTLVSNSHLKISCTCMNTKINNTVGKLHIKCLTSVGFFFSGLYSTDSSIGRLFDSFIYSLSFDCVN